MPTTPNGIPYPGNPATEPPNGPLQMQQIAQAVDSKIVGRFGTAAERDKAITQPSRGQLVMIGHIPWVRTSVMWAPISAGMRAQRNVDTPLATTGSWTAFTSNTNWSELDPYGMRTTGATWIAPWSGWYTLTATIYFASNSTGVRGIRLQPLDGQGIGEGAGQPYELVVQEASTSPNSTTITGTHNTSLEAGQRVQLEGYQNSGGSLVVKSVRMSAVFSLA